MDVIKQNWEWLLQNPWGAIALTMVLVGVTWAAAQRFYQERIEVLKERLSGFRISTEPDVSFAYPDTGRYGRNILSNGTNTVVVNEPVSLRAEFPGKSQLRVLLQGSKELAESENPERMGSWYLAMGLNHNWTPDNYEVANGGSQGFFAEGGWADMQLTFARPGTVQIDAFEGKGQAPAWSRNLKVRRP